MTEMTSVCFFRHALALDERRVKFIIEYAYGKTTLEPRDAHTALSPNESQMTSPPSDQSQVATSQTESKSPHTKEVWFAGSHSDMCVQIPRSMNCY